MQRPKPRGLFILNLLQIIFTLVGAGLIIGGYFSATNSTTDDGFPLKDFLYALGAFFILFPLLLFGVIRFFIRRAVAREEYLINNGIKGKARILNMQSTHVYVNNVPLMVFDLEINTSHGERYETVYRKTVPLQYYSIIKPDRDLPVYVDPNDKFNLFVDFHQGWMDLAKKKAH